MGGWKRTKYTWILNWSMLWTHCFTHCATNQATKLLFSLAQDQNLLAPGKWTCFFPALNPILNSRSAFIFIANCNNYDNYYSHAFTSFCFKSPLLIQTILLDSEEFLVHFAPSCKQLLARLESLVAVVRYSGNNNETKHKTGKDVF